MLATENGSSCYYVRPTGHRPLGLPDEHGTTFSDHAWTTEKNISFHYFFPELPTYVKSAEEKYVNEPVCQNETANFGPNRDKLLPDGPLGSYTDLNLTAT